ncbi:PAS domain S-box protein [Bacteroidales bacterium AH-315-I05]|nr:PAS domain S-box protein [Bacteroidales bacterium AH-315-I05]
MKRIIKSIPQSQIDEINNLLLAYSSGEFHKKGKISPNLDEVDTIIMGVNMLGEELKDTTVSRDFFNSIYSAVADMLFVVSSKGVIEDVNNAACELLKQEASAMIDKKIDIVCGAKMFNQMKTKLNARRRAYSFETGFTTVKGKTLPVSCSCSKILDRHQSFRGYLLIAEDITERKATENLVLRTVVETQEKEQKRLAEDMHDSLGQELSMVKLIFSNINNNLPIADPLFKEMFDTCQSILDNSIAHLRAVCFDLMPSALEKGGIDSAINELLGKLRKQNVIQFHYYSPDKMPRLEKSLEVVIYRVVQEFINNTTKHAMAKNIYIDFLANADKIVLELRDDGRGFNVAQKMKKGGRGLHNIGSRIKAFNGIYKFVSAKNKGTVLKVEFPKQ